MVAKSKYYFPAKCEKKASFYKYPVKKLYSFNSVLLYDPILDL
jgi:hypothetical protein